MLASLVTLTAAVSLLAAAPGVLGHGNIVEPPAVWQKGYPQTGYGSTIDYVSLWGKIDGSTYGYGGEGAIKFFDAMLPKSPYKTLKDLILAKQAVEAPATAQCGFTIKDDAKRVALPSTLTHSSFFHPGPCEVWCDDVKLAYALDCQTAYPNSKIPLDTSKCAGADRLTLYWLAVHGNPWQVYIDCVYLSGSKGVGSSSAGSAADAGGAASTPAATTAKPAATTAPTATTKTPTVTTMVPAATTATPALTPATPALTTSVPVAGEATITTKPAATTAKPTASPAKNCKRNRNRQ